MAVFSKLTAPQRVALRPEAWLAPRHMMPRVEAARFYGIFLAVDRLSTGVVYGAAAAVALFAAMSIAGAAASDTAPFNAAPFNAAPPLFMAAFVVLMLGCWSDLAAMRVPLGMIRSFVRLVYIKILFVAAGMYGLPTGFFVIGDGGSMFGALDGIDVILGRAGLENAGGVVAMGARAALFDLIIAGVMAAVVWGAMRLKAGLAAGDRLLIIPAIVLLGMDLSLAFIMTAGIVGGVFALGLKALRPFLRGRLRRGAIPANHDRWHRIAVMDSFPFLPPLALGFAFAVWPQIAASLDFVF